MKPGRVLAAVDFSDRSRVALQFAARLACQFHAELHVMHAQDPMLAAAAEQHGLNLLRDTEDELRAVTGATWPATQCGLHFDVIVGPASTAIAQAAERERAEVIVMAAHGMSDVRHAVLGSTTESVLRQSAVSVVVVPDEWNAAAPDAADLSGEGPIVAGVDFRIPSIEAAADAADLARALGTELILVHVVPTLTVLPRWREQAEAALANRALKAGDEIARIAAMVAGGVSTRTLVERGRAASRLAAAAQPYPHAIVAVGRSVHPAGVAPPGTTAYQVLAETRVPVLMHVAR